MKTLCVQTGENAEVPLGLSAGPASSSNLYLWSASITGPEKTPYEGYSFELRIEFPPDYPFKPPKVCTHHAPSFSEPCENRVPPPPSLPDFAPNFICPPFLLWLSSSVSSRRSTT